jgi:hypothetical protein
MPFYQDRVPVSAVTGYEYSTGRGIPSLVLLTPDSKIAMPNLADTAKDQLFRLIPRNLGYVNRVPDRRGGRSARIERRRRG